MKIRDNKLVFKSQWVEVYDEQCPCRKCYNPHDFSYSRTFGDKVVNIECATMHNSGCPTSMPRPTHLIRYISPEKREGKKVKCKRCGHTILLGDGSCQNWIMHTQNQR